MNYSPVTVEITITAGTPINVATALGYPYSPGKVIIEARKANTGDVYYQGQAAATATARGRLVPGEKEMLEVGAGGYIDLQLIWIDGDNNGDKVAVTYMKRA